MPGLLMPPWPFFSPIACVYFRVLHAVRYKKTPWCVFTLPGFGDAPGRAAAGRR